MRLLALLCLSCVLSTPAAAQELDLRLTTIIPNLQAVDIAHAGDGSGRLFLVQQNGLIRIWTGSELLATPFLDISDALTSPRGSEQGLLGLAFAPDYASSGRFYLNYTATDGASRISRFRVSAADPNIADRASEEVVLSYAQPFSNHNGGQLAFGPDGMLYIGSGDGGSGSDPLGNGQKLDTLLGKLLRIDVSGSGGYQIPPDNPFVGQPAARPEIWALGLRNPWRLSFDPANGDLYVADVGQDQWEEVNLIASASGGLNFGWSITEGSDCFGGGNCNTSGSTPPIHQYTQSGGQAIIGGHVYRGAHYPRMQGSYFFADFLSGSVWGLRRGETIVVTEHIEGGSTSPARLARSFGTDEVGNLYLASAVGVSLLSDGEPVTPALPIGPGFTGAWFDPAQSGHGIFLEVLDPQPPNFPQARLLAWWFTFDAKGEQAWFGGTGDINGDQAIVDVVQTRGGRWIPNFDPTQIVNEPWGSLLFRFDSCSSGKVEFSSDIGGYGSGSMQLTRLTQPAGLSCP
jgi:glucose/arabinose dehydrogenase